MIVFKTMFNIKHSELNLNLLGLKFIKFKKLNFYDKIIMLFLEGESIYLYKPQNNQLVKNKMIDY